MDADEAALAKQLIEDGRIGLIALRAYHTAIRRGDSESVAIAYGEEKQLEVLKSRREQYVLPWYRVRFSRERARRLVRCYELG
jgi:hypothetical protein